MATAPNGETSLGDDALNLGAVSFSSPIRDHQHLSVDHREARIWDIRRLFTFDHNDSGPRGHGLCDLGDDAFARGVVPVVKDPFQDVHVVSGLETVKEVAFHEVDPIAYAKSVEVR